MAGLLGLKAAWPLVGAALLSATPALAQPASEQPAESRPVSEQLDNPLAEPALAPDAPARRQG